MFGNAIETIRRAQHARPDHQQPEPRIPATGPEGWIECIDRFNRAHGDSEAPYWHGAATNSGLLAAAAWQAEQVALAHYPSKKQRDEGEREGRCDLSISTAEQSVHLHVSQRWPRIARLTWPLPCRKPPLARPIAYPSQLKAGALFVSPGRPGSTPVPRSCKTWSTTCKTHSLRHRLAFPYAYRSLHNELGQYFPGVALLLKQA